MLTAELTSMELADALRKEHGDARFTAKRVARDIDADPRAVTNWLQGKNAPSAAMLLRLMQRYRAVKEAVYRLTEAPTNNELDSDLSELKRLVEHASIRPGLSPMARQKIALVQQILSLSEAIGHDK